MAKPRQLTSRMQHFCRLVASGKYSQAGAYREAYAVGSKKPNPKLSTQQNSASKLMADPLVRARVNALVDLKDKAVATSAVSAKARILERLTEAMDDNDFGVNRIRAIEVMARICGLLNSNVTVENKTQNDPQAVAALLQAKLDQLGLGASSAEDSAQPVLDASSDDRPADDQLN